MRVLPFAAPADIDSALPAIVEHLNAGGLIAYPTETVYGFGGAATTRAAAALRELKRREPHKPFLLLVADAGQAPGVQWSDAALTLAERFWPGPLTIVLPADEGAFPDGVAAADGTVALRASPHPGVRALVRAWSGPITSSSANAPGGAPARSAPEAAAALDALEARGVIVLDGGTLPESEASTIVAVRGNAIRVVRSGAITVERLREQLEGTGIDVG